MYKEISKKLYDTFIVNRSVIGYQHKNGHYTPQRFPVTADIIEKMLSKQISLGAYQQYKNYLRWICFDFDCKGEESSIEYLKEHHIRKLTETLDSYNINYLIEFSGRRGIHVWVVFNSSISKQLGYDIATTLLKKANIHPTLMIGYGLDLFPARGIGNNKYGKLVKIPLSKHRQGNYSYLLESINEKCEKIDNLNSDFIKKQFTLLEAYQTNDPQHIVEIFEIQLQQNEYFLQYKKQYALGGKEISLENIKNALIQLEPLAIIWNHIESSAMTYLDRVVLVGILSHVDNGKDFLNEIFKSQANYNPDKTNLKIEKFSQKYYPITLEYLYSLYYIDLPKKLNPTCTALEYLSNELSLEVKEVIQKNKNNYDFITDIAKKELNYSNYNDEVVDVLYHNELKNIKKYTLVKVEEHINSILEYQQSCFFIDPVRIYSRKESKEKTRQLLTLANYDRLLTTGLIFKFCELYQSNFSSYSYNLNLLPERDVFMPWLTSWQNFKRQVLKFIKLDLFEDMGLLKIDIQNFYNSIYFQSVYKNLKANFKDSQYKNQLENILYYLSSFNQHVMQELKETTQELGIQGIPQGPAYARILAEFYLFQILKSFFQEKQLDKNKTHLIRYVDDIFIVFEKEINGEDLLAQITSFLGKYNLIVNLSKTKLYHSIKDMTNKEKEELDDSMNYEIKSIEDLDIIINDDNYSYEIEKFEQFIQRKSQWDINDANFIFNEYIDPLLIEKYLNNFKNKIIRSEIGRGSIFKKFYNVLLNNKKYAKLFFEKEEYTNIPIQSINFKVFISEFYFNINNTISLIDNIASLRNALEYLMKIEEKSLEEGLTIEALSSYLEKEENNG